MLIMKLFYCLCKVDKILFIMNKYEQIADNQMLCQFCKNLHFEEPISQIYVLILVV